MLFRVKEPYEITEGESVNTEEVLSLGSGFQPLSGGQREEEPGFQKTETSPAPKGCVHFARSPEAYRFFHISS